MSESLDTATPAGPTVFTVLGAVAELERSLIAERPGRVAERASAWETTRKTISGQLLLHFLGMAPDDIRVLNSMNPLDPCRIMFVLGAGASIPFGMPTTVSLLQQLEGNMPLGKLAAEIHKSAAYRFRVSEDSINIEDFFELCLANCYFTSHRGM